MSEEVKKFKLLMIGVFLFLISGCFTYYEIDMLFRGTDGQATVVNLFESRGRRGSVRLRVEYEFKDTEGNIRKDGVTTSLSRVDEFMVKTIPIRYTPGKDGRSRLAGDVNWVYVALFAGSILVIGFGVYRLFREANDDGSKPRKK